MADTLPNTPLPANTWVDLYAATGITVGTKLLLQNLGNSSIRLASSATTPSGDGFKRVYSGSSAYNATGDSGAWAYSPVVDGVANVGEAPA